MKLTGNVCKWVIANQSTLIEINWNIIIIFCSHLHHIEFINWNEINRKRMQMSNSKPINFNWNVDKKMAWNWINQIKYYVSIYFEWNWWD